MMPSPCTIYAQLRRRFHNYRERVAWRRLVRANHNWGARFMDQFETFQMDTRHGPIYVTLTRQTDHSQSFKLVTPCGKPIPSP